MLGAEKNVVDVREEDRDFIRALMLISHEKKDFASRDFNRDGPARKSGGYGKA